jgi:hypothetical protein
LGAKVFLDKQRGRKSLVSEEANGVIVDVARKSDIANKGMTKRELQDSLHRMHPELTKTQVRDTWRKTIDMASTWIA